MYFEKNNIKVIEVPDNLSLGESIMYCWNATGKIYTDLTMLHGDTLFYDFEFLEGDSISIHPNHGMYKMEKSYLSDNGVISGFFSFKNPQLLMKCLIESENNFIKALNEYRNLIVLNINYTGKWLDFGHLNSFFESRTYMTTQRTFNELKISSRILTKSSLDRLKMEAELNWFKKLPSELRLYTPAILTEQIEIINNHSAYSIEYLHLLPLNDLYVFGNMSLEFWKETFQSVKEILLQFKKYPSKDIECEKVDQLYLDKTIIRLKDYKNNIDETLYAKLLNIAQESAKYIEKTLPEHMCISHGDLCFSNILNDTRSKSLKLIDPRGLDIDRKLSIYGDIRYDIAKFFHSVIGCYDLIIAGKYKINNDKIDFFIKDLDVLEGLFSEIFLNEFNVSKKEILAINVHLFISMLPLHSDRPDRQKAMIANAYRLYEKLLQEK
jgi:hypothetical protein